MIDPNEKLNDVELEEFTGYKRPAEQCATLRKQGLKFLTNAVTGRPVITREMINRQLMPQLMSKTTSVDMPNLEAI